MKELILMLALALALAACASETPVPTATPVPPTATSLLPTSTPIPQTITPEPSPDGAEIVGYWFACEFGTSDNCQILDDDGFQFTADGNIYYLEEATQASESECGGSPCFRADQLSIIVSSTFAGDYGFTGTELTVRIDSCTETFEWQAGEAVTQFQSVCLLSFEDAFVKQYTGGVEDPQQDKFDLAIEEYTDAIALNPEFADTYVNRGIAYYLKGDLDRSIADFDQAIELNSQLVAAYYNRGNTYYFKGDLDQAIANYDQAIALDPEYADAYFNRASVYDDKGDLDRAIAGYDQFIELIPEAADAHFNRGLTYYSKGDLDRAIADFERALELGLDPRRNQFAEELLEELGQ